MSFSMVASIVSCILSNWIFLQFLLHINLCESYLRIILYVSGEVCDNSLRHAFFVGVLPTEKQNTKSSCRVTDDRLWLTEDLSNLHIGVGCDSCGMYPIIGKRYKCKDCTEAIGFDLCEACYGTSSKLPGRFNQQHTPDHKFKLDDSKLLYKILMLRAMPEVPQQDVTEANFPHDDQQDHESRHNVPGGG